MSLSQGVTNNILQSHFTDKEAEGLAKVIKLTGQN